MKRPSHKADPAAVARAIEMRRAGTKYDEIEAATGLSAETLHRHFVAAGLAGTRDSKVSATTAAGIAALEIDGDREFAEDYRSTARAALAETRRFVRYAHAKWIKVNGQALDDTMEPRDRVAVQGEVRKSMDSAMKWKQLLVGRPTSHAKTERAAEPGPSPEEAAEMRRLAELGRDAEASGGVGVVEPRVIEGGGASGKAQEKSA